ncbi:uncharacterized protein ACBT57_014155 [Dama dama]
MGKECKDGEVQPETKQDARRGRAQGPPPRPRCRDQTPRRQRFQPRDPERAPGCFQPLPPSFPSRRPRSVPDDAEGCRPGYRGALPSAAAARRPPCRGPLRRRGTPRGLRRRQLLRLPLGRGRGPPDAAEEIPAGVRGGAERVSVSELPVTSHSP